MHQVQNYQDFLKWGGCLNELEGFIPKICSLSTPIEKGTANPTKNHKKRVRLGIYSIEQVKIR